MIIKNPLLYPNYLSISNVFSELLKSEHEELSKIDNLMSRLLDEITPNRADAWLSDWEELLAIENPEGQTSDERQATIMSKLRSSGTLTRKRLKEIALSFKNGEVEFIEDIPNFSFVVKFTSTLGKPPNFNDFMKAVEKTVPAHLSVTYEFTYNTYESLKKYKHGEVNNYTHQELRNEVQ
jgi:hypothetical protein